jgi:hypothetical protein
MEQITYDELIQKLKDGKITSEEFSKFIVDAVDGAVSKKMPIESLVESSQSVEQQRIRSIAKRAIKL